MHPDFTISNHNLYQFTTMNTSYAISAKLTRAGRGATQAKGGLMRCPPALQLLLVSPGSAQPLASSSYRWHVLERGDEPRSGARGGSGGLCDMAREASTRSSPTGCTNACSLFADMLQAPGTCKKLQTRSQKGPPNLALSPAICHSPLFVVSSSSSRPPPPTSYRPLSPLQSSIAHSPNLSLRSPNPLSFAVASIHHGANRGTQNS
eukprot:COSAG02_NODE_5470_length_4297_cov_1.497141_1_plen_206_part_00